MGQRRRTYARTNGHKQLFKQIWWGSVCARMACHSVVNLRGKVCNDYTEYLRQSESFAVLSDVLSSRVLLVWMFLTVHYPLYSSDLRLGWQNRILMAGLSVTLIPLITIKQSTVTDNNRRQYHQEKLISALAVCCPLHQVAHNCETGIFWNSLCSLGLNNIYIYLKVKGSSF